MKFAFSVRNLIMMLGLLAALVAVSGCGNDDDPTRNSDEPQKQRSAQDIAAERKNFSPEPAPVQILTGDESGYRVNSPKVVVVRSTAEEKAMLKQQFSHGVKKQFIAESDFKTRQVIGLFMPKQDPGTHVIVTDVHEKDGKIEVKAILLENGKGCKTAGDQVRPMHIVETRKMEGDPKLILIKQKASPC